MSNDELRITPAIRKGISHKCIDNVVNSLSNDLSLENFKEFLDAATSLYYRRLFEEEDEA